MGLTYRIDILGCRVNHAEAREIESVLRARGLQPAARTAVPDVVVVHTCSVTNQAAAKSRQAIRRAARAGRTSDGIGHGNEIGHPAHSFSRTANPAAPADSPAPAPTPEIFVTGCYAMTDPDEARILAGRASRVIGHAPDQVPAGTGQLEASQTSPGMISRLAERLDRWLREMGLEGGEIDRAAERVRRDPIRTETPECSADAPPILSLPVTAPSAGAGGHLRAELKIQDGCDAHCTFCIIPRTRPILRSKTVADAVTEARQLVDLGHAEIVLTGIFLGAYGHETALRRKQTRRHACPLADLVDAVSAVPGVRRLRLSSLEPGDVSRPLLDAMVACDAVVPHLHLPLQSGSDAILRRMNRQYRVGEYMEMVDQVNEALTVDDLPPAITTDIICGFPGETDDDFEATATIAERVGYLHMHVFPFSPRRGTAAARWTDRFVSPSVARKRVRRLIDLEEDTQDGLALRFRRRLLGRTVRVILEQPDKVRPGAMTGRCDHYALISVPTRHPRGTLVNVRINEVSPDGTQGEVISDTLPLPVLSTA